ncbi:MAG: MarR family winged helix-turn-helix transcriptional regulator [Erythrobacter sp.]|uniref:MarR family winged helix-turn-helix transcriptional regulator n=1 Tax=Erythrobacter sp. TaxID=1042 RepID=UPI0026020323|nr:MarR family winged helix-turn-helix transcriptional regulator [Erythrobacter sp.]MDJ0979852.1 MarR family winged helix-turn-helix transcriptional regulator [Erythrobacter sp.]
MTDTLEAPPTSSSEKTAGAGQLAQFLPYQLSITSNAVSALIAERYRKRFALKVTEWRIMAVLGDASREHETSNAGAGMTQRALTDATLMDKVAVNRACKVLEARGLIARAPNAADGRSHILVLTAEGRDIHREVLPLALATEREILADFSEAEQKRLRTMLERLRVKVEALT